MEDWTTKNEQYIIQACKVSSPKELLACDRDLYLMLIQLGALIMAWIIKTWVEDMDFQREAAKAIIPNQKSKYRHRSNPKKAIEYYNLRRPHGSLNQGKYETPFQAFIRKMRPSTRRKFVRVYRELVSKHAPEYLRYGYQE